MSKAILKKAIKKAIQETGLYSNVKIWDIEIENETYPKIQQLMRVEITAKKKPKKKENPKQEMFFISNSLHGNAVVWWRHKGRGYTTDIVQAGRFTMEQAEKIIERPEDVAWPCDYILSEIDLNAHKCIIDAQYLERGKCIQGKTN